MKQRRRFRLIAELAIHILTIVFFGLGFVIFVYSAFTPALRDRVFNAQIEAILGHTGTFICLTAFCLLATIGSLLLALRTIRLLRDRAYLEAEPPTWEDFM